MAGPQFKPYAKSAQGIDPTMTDPQYSDQTNSAITGVHPTDSNMMGAAPPNRSMDDIMRRGIETFGPDAFMAIMDDVLRLAASEDINGRLPPPDTSGQLPPPDFGAQQPYTTMDPTDGNLMALEDHYGYPVSANKTSGPVRNLPSVPGSIAPKRGMMGRKIN